MAILTLHAAMDFFFAILVELHKLWEGPRASETGDRVTNSNTDSNSNSNSGRRRRRSYGLHVEERHLYSCIIRGPIITAAYSIIKGWALELA